MQRKFLLHTGAITSSVQILQFLPCSPRCYSSDPKCRLSAHVRRSVPNNLSVFVVRLCFSSCFLRCKFKFCAIFNHEERRYVNYFSDLVAHVQIWVCVAMATTISTVMEFFILQMIYQEDTANIWLSQKNFLFKLFSFVISLIDVSCFSTLLVLTDEVKKSFSFLD